MPRPNTPEERERIRARLLRAGRDQFVRHGLHKATIGELAQAAGIGKGSFYAFFENKEALFHATQMEEEAAFKSKLLDDLEAIEDPVEAVTRLLLSAAQRLEQHPLLGQLLDPSVIDTLFARLPEAYAQHRADDQRFFIELAKRWLREGILAPHVEPQTMFDGLFGMFALSLQRELLGRERFERVAHEFARALAIRWVTR